MDTHAFYTLIICKLLITAHITNLFIDVSITVDSILMGIPCCYPAKNRIINLSGVRIVIVCFGGVLLSALFSGAAVGACVC